MAWRWFWTGSHSVDGDGAGARVDQRDQPEHFAGGGVDIPIVNGVAARQRVAVDDAVGVLLFARGHGQAHAWVVRSTGPAIT